MIMPTLRDVFFNNGFSDDMIPELNEAANEFSKVMEKVETTYNMPFSTADELRGANTSECSMSQYMGFLQGFKWAVYLLTGHIDNEKEGEQICT